MSALGSAARAVLQNSDLLSSILLQLPGPDLLICASAVCKRWHDLIRNLPAKWDFASSGHIAPENLFGSLAKSLPRLGCLRGHLLASSPYYLQVSYSEIPFPNICSTNFVLFFFFPQCFSHLTALESQGFPLHLHSVTSLTSLVSLSTVSLPPEVDLSFWPNLTHLEASVSRYFSETFDMKLFSSLRKLVSVQLVNISQNQQLINMHSFASTHPHLRHLDLGSNGAEKLLDNGEVSLFTALTSARLDPAIAPQFFGVVPKFPQSVRSIRSLFLSWTRATRSSFHCEISSTDFPNLERLDIEIVSEGKLTLRSKFPLLTRLNLLSLGSMAESVADLHLLSPTPALHSLKISQIVFPLREEFLRFDSLVELEVAEFRKEHSDVMRFASNLTRLELSYSRNPILFKAITVKYQEEEAK